MAAPHPLSQSPERFFNRELSWLNFNARVLEEAANPSHPVMERLRFLSISANNLDEFYMVRYAGLREQERAGIKRLSQDGLTASEQVRRIEKVAGDLMQEQQVRWKELRKALGQAGVKIIDPGKLRKTDITWLTTQFLNKVFPILTPLAVDPAHPFPFMPNRGFALAMALKSETDGETMTGIVPIPAFADRFLRLPDRDGQTQRYIALEQVIPLFVDRLFPGYAEQ
ncbi:MAG: RNA degradosome polyphosphate kinase, partial [Pseudomonadota bacterium]